MSSFDAYVRLEGTLNGTIRTDERMARHTSYRIGGPAALFIECASVADLALSLSVLDEEGVSWELVGRGSNLLVSDEGYDGAIIVLTGEFAVSDIPSFAGADEDLDDRGDASGGYCDDRDDDRDSREKRRRFETGQTCIVSAGAGCYLPRLVQAASGRGLSGFEFAIGIPGSLGGALVMNAGTPTDCIGSIVDTVTSYSLSDGLKIRHGDEIEWMYRASSLPRDEVVVECTLRLICDEKKRIHERMEEHLSWRKAHQPLGKPSCGSVFRNPAGVSGGASDGVSGGASAGELIEACGLKGARCGDACISDVHANFIINTGSASANDVLALIYLARDTVEKERGIRLRPELKFLGFPKHTKGA